MQQQKGRLGQTHKCIQFRYYAKCIRKQEVVVQICTHKQVGVGQTCARTSKLYIGQNIPTYVLFLRYSGRIASLLASLKEDLNVHRELSDVTEAENRLPCPLTSPPIHISIIKFSLKRFSLSRAVSVRELQVEECARCPRDLSPNSYLLRFGLKEQSF